MKNSNLFILFFLSLILTGTGCAKVSHLDELLRLQGYSNEKDRLGSLVEQQNKTFERLLAETKNGTLGKYRDQKTIWKNFGQPIFESRVAVAGVPYQVWMYRYSTKLFGSEKVYLYFDLQGDLKIYDYSPGGAMTAI